MKKTWWKEAVGYQIYPRSFCDSNGDGIGDLRGIISKLDYIKDLGIDIIWICPMYKSPNDDNGYDISNYKDILDDFGNMDDFDMLLEEVHARKMKLIIDLVINHTSDEHEWFLEAKSSKDNDKRDWYIWRKGEENKEPNNWESIFKGSAWEYDDNTQEYFLHLFSKRQPDLNWENKEMRQAIYEMINWWLDKGIDGFRVDAISHIKKDQTFEDLPNPENKQYVESFDKHMNYEGIHDFLDELKAETFAKYDIVTVGEANGVKADVDAHKWVSEDEGKFNMVFQFEHLDLWETKNEDVPKVVALKKALSSWQYNLHDIGWNALFIENHDISRVVSTLGNDSSYWSESAKALAMMYFMQQGTPFIYQGQEIGMKNVSFNTIEEYNDIKCINVYKEKIAEGMSKEDALEIVWKTSRDNARTPMQWNKEKNAGFSTGTPWIGVNPSYKNINVEDQINDKNSILNFYKELVRIKKSNDVLIYGKYNLILEEDEYIYAYIREFEDERYIVITNLSDKICNFSFDETLKYENMILSNYIVENHEDIKEFEMKPWECRLYKI